MAHTYSFSDFLEAFMRLFYPAYCCSCGSFLELEDNIACQLCRDKLDTIAYSLEDCLIDQKLNVIDYSWALFPYQSPLKEILHQFKFSKQPQLIKILREHLRILTLALSAETYYDALIPVPLSRLHKMEREFNQSEVIAREVSFISKIPIKTHLIKKRFSAVRQSELDRKARQFNLKQTFYISRKPRVRGKTFLIIDDIMTTGATADTVASLLKNCGAKRVDLLAIAYTERK